jgi:glycosyltransferase involved in cell wall biosynthesis
MLFINAFNIHDGGGKTLLAYLLAELDKRNIPYELYLDSRFGPLTLPAESQLVWLRSMSEKLGLFARLAKRMGSDDILLNFGNLPPDRPMPGFNVTYFQRTYLMIDKKRLLPKTCWERLKPAEIRLNLKTALLKAYIRRYLRATNFFLLQTESVKRNFQAYFGLEDERILLLPYYQIESFQPLPLEKKYDIIYVSLPNPHKNHETLFEALKLLAQAGVFPKLAVTIPAPKRPGDLNDRLLRQLAAIQREQAIEVTNLGLVPFAELNPVYNQARALVFPSKTESFGLPLAEAARAGLAVIAPELDYVRDIIEPSETFDANSAVSLARAIRRFLDRPETKPARVVVPNEINQLIDLLAGKHPLSQTKKGNR